MSAYPHCDDTHNTKLSHSHIVTRIVQLASVVSVSRSGGTPAREGGGGIVQPGQGSRDAPLARKLTFARCTKHGRPIVTRVFDFVDTFSDFPVFDFFFLQKSVRSRVECLDSILVESSISWIQKNYYHD